MEQRNLKVYEAPGPKRNIPQIRFQGNWLSNQGFNVGDQYRITCVQGKLVIEIVSDDSSSNNN